MNATAESGLAEALGRIVYREGRLLDERRFEEWLDLYTDDAVYWVPAAPGQTSPENHVSLFYDDKQTMVARIKRLRHPEIHAQLPATRTCRLIASVSFDCGEDEGTRAGTGRDDATRIVHSSHMIVEYRPGWEQRILAGRCRHRFRLEDGRWLIACKRLELINCDSAFAALTVPL